MKTAVIYARYSSENQTEQSIEGQLRVCGEYAKTHDILILDTYIDRAMTGTNDNRPDFQRMLKDSAKKNWNYVLVYKTDRFSRNKFEMATHKNTLKQNGVKVLSATEFIPEGPEGIILESMLEGYAEYYSAELSQKVKRGMNETRLKGNFTGGRVLYGYRVENHKILIDEDRANVVRYIFEQYSMGAFVVDIISELHSKGIYYYGNKWCKSTVYNILKNEKYAGIYRFNGQVFENMYPRIVPAEIFDKVRTKSNLNNDNGSRSVKVTYLLKNKIKCGYCGKPMSAETGTSQNGEVKHYYKCYGKKNKNGCTKNNIRKDILEKAVIETIVNALSTPHIMVGLVNALLLEQQRLNGKSDILNILLQEKKQTDKSLNNLVSAIEQGIISSTTNKRLHELEKRQAELETQIIIEKNKSAVTLTEKDIRQFYKAMLELKPRLLIESLVKEIIVYDDKIKIICNSPLKTFRDGNDKTKISPDENQGFSFYITKYNCSFKDPHKLQITTYIFEIEMYI